MPSPSPFVVHNTRLHAILGESLTLELLAENEAYPFAYEAGVFTLSATSSFITSNRIKYPGSTGTGVTCDELSIPIPMVKGEVNYKDGILVCTQGSMYAPSGLSYMSTKLPCTTRVLKADFHGRPFTTQ
ncbi:hypothetical protein BDV10DRAFT_182004 [Aspergillus recurvatus]